MIHIGDPWMTSGGYPVSLGTDGVRILGMASALSFPFFLQIQEEEKKNWKNGLIHIPLFLNSSQSVVHMGMHPSQKCKHH